MYESSKASSRTYCRHICKETMDTNDPDIFSFLMLHCHACYPSSRAAWIRTLFKQCILSYLQAKVLHPFLYGGGYCSLGFPQGLWALLTASQQTGITGNVQSSSCNGHLGGESDNERTETVSQWTMFTHPWIHCWKHVTITELTLTLYYLTSVLWYKDMITYSRLDWIFSGLFTLH